MEQITYQEAFQMLRQTGFIGAEIDRLYQFRLTYRPNEQDQPPLDLHHLFFARWLVTTGRLTDQLPCEAGSELPSTQDEPEATASFPRRRFLFFSWSRHRDRARSGSFNEKRFPFQMKGEGNHELSTT